jgi:hypothetical protein
MRKFAVLLAAIGLTAIGASAQTYSAKALFNSTLGAATNTVGTVADLTGAQAVTFSLGVKGTNASMAGQIKAVIDRSVDKVTWEPFATLTVTASGTSGVAVTTNFSTELIGFYRLQSVSGTNATYTSAVSVRYIPQSK